jgi:hypothetical protein
MGAALVITNTAPALSESPVCALLNPGEARPIASPAMNNVRSTLRIKLAPTVLVAIRLINKATEHTVLCPMVQAPRVNESDSPEKRLQSL